MRIAIPIAALTLVAAAPAADAPVLNIARGQTVTVQIAGSGFTAAAPIQAEVAPFEAAAVNTLWQTGKYKVGSVGTGAGHDGVPETPPIAPDRIKLKMVEYPAGQTMLAVENGYAQSFVYRAVMHRGGGAQPTTVCLVMPGKRTMEHWPFKIDRLELRDLHLVDWKRGDAMPCQ
ncbi:hypothetical protein [Sphingomonas sp. KR3-1]|uniref:hypothetical protein n=1 Tax=Sphingomonas sp. KR3-1 TaxID=3156611 RepID=UPI0032B49BD8